MDALFLLLFSYVLGSIPFGVIVAKMCRGIDIREYGSGNIGATNVYRALGPGPGAAVWRAGISKRASTSSRPL